MKTKDFLLMTLAIVFSVDASAQHGFNINSPQSTVDVNGSLGLAYRETSIATTLTSSDYTLVITGAGGITVTLPAANTCKNRVYRISNAATANILYSVTITESFTGGVRNFIPSKTIDMIQSDGALWKIVNSGVNDNIYNVNGTLNANRTLSQATNTLNFTSTAITGTSHFTVDGTTLNIDAVNNRVGIGTGVPQAPLHVEAAATPAVRIVDGTQGLGKVLTSGSNGDARWALPGTSLAKLGTIPTGTTPTVTTIDDPTIAGTQNIAYSGMSITLSPGKYQVNFTLWCSPEGSALTTSNDGFAAVFLSKSSSTNEPPTYLTPIKSIIIPRLYNRAAVSPDYYGSGNVAVNIDVTTTLYLWTYMSPGNWSASPRQIQFRYDSGFYGPYVQFYAIPFDVE
jgi:hypothetical protein